MKMWASKVTAQFGIFHGGTLLNELEYADRADEDRLKGDDLENALQAKTSSLRPWNRAAGLMGSGIAALAKRERDV